VDSNTENSLIEIRNRLYEIDKLIRDSSNKIYELKLERKSLIEQQHRLLNNYKDGK